MEQEVVIGNWKGVSRSVMVSHVEYLPVLQTVARRYGVPLRAHPVSADLYSGKDKGKTLYVEYGVYRLLAKRKKRFCNLKKFANFEKELNLYSNYPG